MLILVAVSLSVQLFNFKDSYLASYLNLSIAPYFALNTGTCTFELKIKL